MIFFGDTESHGNAIHFGDLAVLDAMTSYTIFLPIRLEALVTAARNVLVKANAGDVAGWAVQLQADEKLAVTHGNGTSFLAATAMNTALTAGALRTVVITWDGSTVRYYLDGVADGSPAYTRSITANSRNVTAGNIGGASPASGTPCSLGHVLIYAGEVLTALEVEALTRNNLPVNATLDFHAKLNWNDFSKKVKEEVSATDGTYIGASQPFPNRANNVDAFFRAVTPAQHILAGGHFMRRNVSAQPTYSLTVPLHFASNKIMSLMQASHDSLPRPASFLTDIEDHGLLDVWRANVFRLVGVETLKRERLVRLDLKDHELFASTYWSTEKTPSGFNSSSLDGVAFMILGGVGQQDRGSKAYIFNPNLVVSPDGVAIATVPSRLNKFNHLGYLSEEATTNDVLNPVFTSGISTNWTATDNDGTITDDASGEAFVDEDTITTHSPLFAWASGATAPTLVADAISVLSADGFRRLMLVYDNPADFSNANGWILQRSSDSFYWNNASEAWQSGTVTNGTDLVGADGALIRYLSRPILCNVTTNWTLTLTMHSAGGTTARIKLVQLTADRYVYSPLIDNTTTNEDKRTRIRTALPQIVYAGRGTVSIRVQIEQQSDELETNDELCLLYWQYGTTDGDDFDAILYDENGGSPQFVYVRWISGSEDARATFAISPDTVRDEVYEIMVRWTSDADGELGVAARTMSIFARNVATQQTLVKGTDAVASASHSTSEVHTELWVGASGESAHLRAMNPISHINITPRVLGDEEAA